MYKLLGKKTVYQTFPFDVEELDLELNGTKLEKPYHRITCGDWVNILPITHDGQAILIRQPRAGSLTTVLETPGGIMEPDEKDPTLTAARELEEETGFTTQRIVPLASINPNPAIQNNVCHFFLGLSCHLREDRQHFPDQDEFIKIAVTPVHELEHLVRTGQVNHSLSALTIMLAQKYLQKWLKE